MAVLASVKLDYNTQPTWLSHKITPAPDVEQVLTTDEAFLHAGDGCACEVALGEATATDMAKDMIDYVQCHLEELVSRRFMAATIVSYANRFPFIDDPLRIPMPPTQSVTKVEYLDEDGNQQQWANTEWRLTEGDDEPKYIVPLPGKQWPATLMHKPDAIAITYEAGYATKAADVPAKVKQPARILFTHMWRTGRDAVVVGTITKEMEFALNYSLNKLYWGDYSR